MADNKLSSEAIATGLSRQGAGKGSNVSERYSKLRQGYNEAVEQRKAKKDMQEKAKEDKA